MLGRIQNDLFDLGADLCTPHKENPEHPPLRVTGEQVQRLEAEIDTMNERLEPLSSFVLPGGSVLSAHLHHARTVVRRAERHVTRLSGTEQINTHAVRYVNRLSDHLFVLARTPTATDAMTCSGSRERTGDTGFCSREPVGCPGSCGLDRPRRAGCLRS